MRKLIVGSAVSVLALGALAAGCGGDSGASSVEVKISVPGAAAAIHSATIVVDYARSGAKPQLSGGKPACTSILPHVSCSFSDDGSGKLTIEASAPQGFSTPVDLAVCRMIPGSAGVDGAAIGGKIQVSLADARGSTGEEIEEQRGMKVASAATRRETTPPDDPASAAAAGSEGSAGEGAGAAVAGGGAGAVPGATAGQGMVVTREDLAARDRKRAADQQAARATERPIIAPSQGGTAADPGADGGMDDEGSEPEDSEENDPEEFAADATKYGIRFDLATTQGPVGALQVEIDYSGGSGAWLGAKGGVDCRWSVAASLHACNDKGRGRLACAVVDSTGFTGPTALMECTFKSKNAVSAGDFRVDVVDSSGVDLAPIEARVVVAGVYAR